MSIYPMVFCFVPISAHTLRHLQRIDSRRMRRTHQLVLSVFLAVLTALNGWAVSAAGVADAQCQTQMRAVCCAHADTKQCVDAKSPLAKVTSNCSCQMSCGSSCAHCLQAVSALDSAHFISADGRPVVEVSDATLYAFHSIYLLFRPPRSTV